MRGQEGTYELITVKGADEAITLCARHTARYTTRMFKLHSAGSVPSDDVYPVTHFIYHHGAFKIEDATSLQTAASGEPRWQPRLTHSAPPLQASPLYAYVIHTQIITFDDSDPPLTSRLRSGRTCPDANHVEPSLHAHWQGESV